MSGQVLGDRYRLDGLLGRGGMATVWRGWDLRLERAVAVKTIDRTGMNDPSMAQRFDREARTVARLAHPNIVAVYDVGTQDGIAYLVMELIEGVSLATLLADGPMPISQAVAIAAQTCDALAAAHAAGVVHRDVKPANIMVTPAGGVKVCDFGIARQLHAAGQTLTAPATAIGTSDYMAPEQAAGDPVDARTDLYALGCVLYALLSTAPPFTGDGPISVVYQHLQRPPAPVRSRRADVPAELDDLVCHLLAKNPADRPADAAQVRARLAGIGGQPTGVLPRIPPTTAVRGARGAAAVATPTRTLPSQGQIDEHQLEGHPGERGRLASGGVALAAAAVIVLVVAAVVAASLLTHPGAHRQASPPQITSTSTISPTPPDSPTQASSAPAAPADELARLQAVLQQQTQTGQLDPHDAHDLSHQLDDLTHTLDHGQPRGVTDKINSIRDKLTQLRQDGKITTAGYDALTTGLDQFAGSLPATNDGGN